MDFLLGAWPSCLDLPADTMGSQRGEKVGAARTASPPGETKRVGASKKQPVPWRISVSVANTALLWHLAVRAAWGMVSFPKPGPPSPRTPAPVMGGFRPYRVTLPGQAIERLSFHTPFSNRVLRLTMSTPVPQGHFEAISLNP